jgi:hypothetical protein
MERQARYVSGALVDAPEVKLPPEYAVRFPLQAGIHRRADSIIGRVSEVFDVSREAAEVRLLQRGHLIPLSSGLVCGDA